LNQKVFKRLGFSLPKEICEQVAFAEPGTIECILKLLRVKLAQYQARQGPSRTAQLQAHTPGSTPWEASFSPSLLLPTLRTPLATPGQTVNLQGQFLTPPEQATPRASGASQTASRGCGNSFSVSQSENFDDEEDHTNNNNNNNRNKYSKTAGRALMATPESDLISSFPTKQPEMTAGAATAAAYEEEIQELRALNKVLEIKSSKMDQLLRLKDAKIAALTSRLQNAGLI